MKLIVGIYLVFSVFSFRFAFGQDYTALAQQFDSSTILPNIHFGFSLYDLDKDQYVFDINEHKYFTPASNTKIFTLLSALKNLDDSISGIQYIERGDSLIFWGTGDPTFLHPKLDNKIVYNFLLNSNKKLFYAVQNVSEENYRNGWSIEDFQEGFQPDISPFPIYGNLARFTQGSNQVDVKPLYFQKNTIINSTADSHFTVLRKTHENEFLASLPNNSKKSTISKPFIWTDSLVVNLLSDTLHKEVQILYDYSKPEGVLTLKSLPRNVVLREMMLPSDNFLAEQLLMLVSMVRYNKFSTDLVQAEMASTYYNSFQDTVILKDGSGLSTYSKVSPRGVIETLLAIEDCIPNDDKRFLFFPAGGIDGTLKSTYKLDEGNPYVFAKTGTMSAVHNQSGYLITRSGRRYAFSFLNNNFVVPTATIRNEMVRIMTFIRQNY